MSTHQAAVLPSHAPGSLTITPRPTPPPSLNELLVSVSSIALNPVDWYQRDFGFPPIPNYPAIIGSDVAGTVVTSDNDLYPPGTRVTAFATCNYTSKLDYGAFQKKVLVPTTHVAPLPTTISFNHGATIPLALRTVFNGFYTIGMPISLEAKYLNQGILIWGGSSSVGSIAIQVAKSSGFTTFVTASQKHHAYLSSKGADHLFDYSSPTVVESIIATARKNKASINIGYHAAGPLASDVESSMRVLQALKTEETETAKLAVAPPMPQDLAKFEGVEASFVLPPTNPEERDELYGFIFNIWLKEKLETGEFVPSPEIQVVKGGLEALDDALNILKGGVSGVKIVVEI